MIGGDTGWQAVSRRRLIGFEIDLSKYEKVRENNGVRASGRVVPDAVATHGHPAVDRHAVRSPSWRGSIRLTADLTGAHGRHAIGIAGPVQQESGAEGRGRATTG